MLKWPLWLKVIVPVATAAIVALFALLGMGIIGFCYANHFKKRGLIIGILIVLIHLIIIYLIKYFSTNTLDLNAIKIGIQVLVGGIGGILGSNVKKVF